MRWIGADRVIDYTRDEVTRRPERYDLILDTAALEQGHARGKVLITVHGHYSSATSFLSHIHDVLRPEA